MYNTLIVKLPKKQNSFNTKIVVSGNYGGNQFGQVNDTIINIGGSSKNDITLKNDTTQKIRLIACQINTIIFDGIGQVQLLDDNSKISQIICGKVVKQIES